MDVESFVTGNKLAIVAVLALAVGLGAGYLGYGFLAPQQGETGIYCENGTVFSPDAGKIGEIGSAFEDYFYVMTGQKYTLSYANYVDAGDFVILNFMVDGIYPESIYITKDYKYILQQPMEFSTIKDEISYYKSLAEAETGAPQGTLAAPKSDKPKVELFIMSYCPYGLQAAKAVEPVAMLLGDSADISIKFVDYIMHAKQEIDENLREYCIQEEQKDRFWPYMKCFMGSGNTEACLVEAGVDTANMEACVAATDEEYGITTLYNDRGTWLSGYYPLFPVHEAENNAYGVQGSPTLVINGVAVSPARSPEAYKQAVCAAFSTQPGECAVQLSSDAMPPMFGYDGTGSTTAATCG